MSKKFCVLTDSPYGNGTLARRDVSGDGPTNVRSGNEKWTADFFDAWLMDRTSAEEIAGNLAYNNPRFSSAEKAEKRMSKNPNR
jgi:hypothetical protein